MIGLPTLEPTYEGLKHAITWRCSSGYGEALEPTYEGLKRTPERPSWSPRRPALEPTYEGLKQKLAEIRRAIGEYFGAYL